MSVPTYDQFIEPLLRVLAEHPDGVRTADAHEAVAERLGLDDDARAERVPSGVQLLYKSRNGCAHDRLKRAGFSTRPPRVLEGDAAGLSHGARQTRLSDDDERLASVDRTSRLKPKEADAAHRPPRDADAVAILPRCYFGSATGVGNSTSRLVYLLVRAHRAERPRHDYLTMVAATHDARIVRDPPYVASWRSSANIVCCNGFVFTASVRGRRQAKTDRRLTESPPGMKPRKFATDGDHATMPRRTPVLQRWGRSRKPAGRRARGELSSIEAEDPANEPARTRQPPSSTTRTVHAH